MDYMKTSALQITTYVLLALCVPMGCASDSRPMRTSLCAAIKQIDRIEGQEIEISGVVQSDALHPEIVQDETCPDDGAQLQVSRGALNNGSAERLRAAIMEHPAGTLDKRIEITVRGYLRYETQASLKIRVFTVEEILGLKVIRETEVRR
jgi:hypothetical protein